MSKGNIVKICGDYNMKDHTFKVTEKDGVKVSAGGGKTRRKRNKKKKPSKKNKRKKSRRKSKRRS